MSSTATTTCPSFCISPHDEPAGVEPVHLDAVTYVPSILGSGRVNVERLASHPEPLIYVDDRAYTAAQADALIDAIARRVDALGVTR